MVNINKIAQFGDGWILIIGRDTPIRVNETYEEIKQLIEKTQYENR